MFPQNLDFHVHLVRDHRRLKYADLLNSVYQLSIAALYQFTSAGDTLARQDVQQANTLYQALISYQVMYWYLYRDAVQDSITRYRRFLDEQALDSTAHPTALEARLLKLNPHEYSPEYKDYRERTLRFLRTSLTAPTLKPAH